MQFRPPHQTLLDLSPTRHRPQILLLTIMRSKSSKLELTRGIWTRSFLRDVPTLSCDSISLNVPSHTLFLYSRSLSITTTYILVHLPRWIVFNLFSTTPILATSPSTPSLLPSVITFCIHSLFVFPLFQYRADFIQRCIQQIH